jgi:O-antigen/teichoic acid export membrane protein
VHRPQQTGLSGRSEAGAAPQDLLDTPAAGPAAIRGSVVRAGGYVATAAVALVSVSLLIRHVGVVEFGHYVTVLSLVTLAATLSDAGLTTLAIREYSIRGPAERERLMANLLGLRLVLTAVGVLGAVMFALAAGYEQRLVLGTLIAGFGVLLTAVQGTYAVPLSSMLRLGTVTALDFARQLLATVLTVVLVLSGATLLGFFAIPIPVGIAILIATRRYVRGEVPLAPRLDRDEWRALMIAVVPIGVAVTLAAIYFRVTILAMSLIASDEQTGYYATAYRVLEVIVLLPGLLVGSAFPVLARAARDDSERLAYATQRLSEAMVVLGAWVGVTVVLTADFAIRILAGGASAPSVPVLQIQSVAIAVAFVSTTWALGLVSLARYGSLLRITAATLTLLLTLTIVLVPVLEAQGAAIAIATADTAGALLLFVVLRGRNVGVRFPTGTVLRVAPAVALALATLLIPQLSSVARGVIGSAVYFIAILVLRAIPPEVMHAFRERFARRPAS